MPAFGNTTGNPLPLKFIAFLRESTIPYRSPVDKISILISIISYKWYYTFWCSFISNIKFIFIYL